MHRAQGITFDTAITVMSSEDRLLNSRSLLYVLTSRARDDLTLYTDDKELLAERIADHDGAPPHAHDLARERPRAEDAVLDPHAGELEKPEADTLALDAALARFESSLAPKTPEPSTLPAAEKEPEVTRERAEPELDTPDLELDDDWRL